MHGWILVLLFQCLYIKIKFRCSSSHSYILYKPDGNKAGYEVTSTVAHKGERNTRNGHKTKAHPNVFKNVEKHHCTHSHANHFSKGVVGTAFCIVKTAVHYNEK